VPEPPSEITELARQRAQARAARRYAEADALRERIADAGWTVRDTPQGWTLEPEASEPSHLRERSAPGDVPSLLDAPPTADATLHWVCEGWPEDIARAVASFRSHAGGREVGYVVADVTGVEPEVFGEGVEVVSLEAGTGWAAARNAGLRRSTGRVVFALDGSIEAMGDVFGPLESALADDAVGIAGPFGIVTNDLREFDEAPGPGPCDAVEGYLMAMRRERLRDAGLFDEKFKWYRTADIEYSFRVKDLGLATTVVDVPVRKHEHRMWHATDPATRERLSKRNYYRFLDRWRDRWDLVLDPEPPQDHHHSHDHEG
jgi:cysteinyl-tRNA synthetase